MRPCLNSPLFTEIIFLTSAIRLVCSPLETSEQTLCLFEDGKKNNSTAFITLVKNLCFISGGSLFRAFENAWRWVITEMFFHLLAFQGLLWHLGITNNHLVFIFSPSPCKYICLVNYDNFMCFKICFVWADESERHILALPSHVLCIRPKHCY